MAADLCNGKYRENSRFSSNLTRVIQSKNKPGGGPHSAVSYFSRDKLHQVLTLTSLKSKQSVNSRVVTLTLRGRLVDKLQQQIATISIIGKMIYYFLGPKID